MKKLYFKRFFLITIGILSLYNPSLSIAQKNYNNNSILEVSSIEDCIDIALRHSPIFLQKNLEIKAEDKNISITRSNFFPHIDLNGSYLRSEYPDRIIPPQENNQPGIFNKDIFNGGIELTLPIFLGGKRFYNYSTAKLLKDVAVNIRFMTKQELIFNIVSTYLKIIETKKAIRAVDANIKLLSKELKDIDLKLKVGKVAQIDRLKVIVPISNQKAKKKELEQDILVLDEILKKLMGIDKDIKISPDPNEKIEFNLYDQWTHIEKLITVAKKNRPEFLAAKKQVKIARLNLKTQQAQLLPSLNLKSSYNIRSGSPYSQDGPKGSIDHLDYWQASLNLQIPIFHGGAILNNISKAKIKLSIAKQHLRDIELSIKKDITQAISDITSSKYLLVTANQNRKLAMEVLRIEKLKYRMGKNTINDVLDAHANWLNAELNYIKYSFKYNISKLNLYKAIGYNLENIVKNK